MSPARIQHILCPVDASEPSAQACRLAGSIARWSQAQVTALHVREPVYTEVSDLLPAAVERRCRDAEQAMLTWMRTQFAPALRAGVRVDPVTIDGAPAKEILAYALRAPADLIVMGTHGTSGFERLLLGSVAERVLRRARCPVLTVPPHSAVTSRLPFTHILCTIDFSDWSLAALEFAMTAALGSGASLTLTHVLEWPWHEPPAPEFDELPNEQAVALADYRLSRECEALTRLEALRPEELRDRCRARISHGRPYVEILRIAADEQADLIVLGVHGRNPVDMALFGSTTNQIVRHATCPVLTVRR
jgi:nucleotide-binding universal stress UspA family protein